MWNTRPKSYRGMSAELNRLVLVPAGLPILGLDGLLTPGVSFPLSGLCMRMVGKGAGNESESERERYEYRNGGKEAESA